MEPRSEPGNRPDSRALPGTEVHSVLHCPAGVSSPTSQGLASFNCPFWSVSRFLEERGFPVGDCHS